MDAWIIEWCLVVQGAALHSPLRQNSCGKLVSLNDVWWCRVLHYIHHKYNKEHTLSPFAGLAFHPLDGILQVCNHSFVLSFICACIHLCMHSFVHSFIWSFVCSFIRSFVHSFTHPSIYPSIHPTVCAGHLSIYLFGHLFVHSLIHLFVRLFFHSLTHSFTHSFIHVFVLSVAGCLFAIQMCYCAAM